MSSSDCIALTGTLEVLDPTMTATVTIASTTLTQSGMQVPALTGTWSAITNPYILGFQFQYTNSNLAGGYTNDSQVVGAGVWNGTNGVLAGVTYSLRYRAYGLNNTFGPWSNWLSVTAPTTFTSNNTQNVGSQSSSAINTQLGALTGAADTTAPAQLAAPTVAFTTGLDAAGNVMVTLTGTTLASVSPNVIGYEFSLALNGGNANIYPTTLLSFSWGTNEGVAYALMVRAVKVSGARGPWSTAATGTTPSDSTPPGAPVGVTAAAGIQAVYLSATGPSDKDLDHLEWWGNTTGVVPNPATQTSMRLGVSAAVPSGIAVFTVPNLTIGATWSFWARAVDSSGNPSGFTAAGANPVTVLGTAAASISGQITSSQISSVVASSITGILATVNIPGLDASKIISGALTGATVPTSGLTGTITGTQIGAGAVGTSNIASGSITSSLLAAAAVLAANLGTGAVTSSALGAGAVTSTALASGAVTSTALATAAVTAAALAAGSVGSAAIAAQAIGATQLGIGVLSNTVSNGDFSSGDLSFWGNGNRNASFASATGPSGAGDAVILAAASGADSSIASNAFSTVPGVTYVFTVAYGGGTAASIGANFQLFSQASKPITAVSQSGTTQSTLMSNGAIATTWSTVQFVWTCPANCNWTSIWLGNHSSTTQVGFTNITCARQLGTNNLGAGAVGTSNIASAAITAALIAAGAVGTSQISAGAITSALVAANAIGSGQLANGAVGSLQLGTGAVTAAAIGMGVLPNTVVNGDFASGDLSGWSNLRSNLATVITASGPGGTANAAQVPASSGGVQAALGCNAFQVIPGQTYVFSFAYGGGSTASANGAYFRLYYQATKPTAPAYVPTTATQGSVFENQAIPTGWVNEQLTWTAPAGAGWVSIWLLNTTTTTPVDFTTITCVPQIGTNNIAASAVTAAQISPAAVTASKLQSGATDNLVADYTCSDPSYWTLSGAAIPGNILVGQSSTGLAPAVAFTVLQCSTALLFSQTSATAGSTLSAAGPKLPVNGGLSYRLAGKFGTTAVGPFNGFCQLLASWYDINGAFISTSTLSGVDYRTVAWASPAPQLETLDSLVTAPTNAVSVVINPQVLVSSTLTPAGSAYFGVPIFQRGITAGAIVAGSITTTQIAAGTITASNIQAGTITGGLIAANTITAGNILANTITAAQIAAGSITATQIQAGTIIGSLIAANTIAANNIVAGTITSSLIAAGTIVSANIAAGTIVAGNIAAATITGSLIQAGAITSSLIAAGTIVATNIAAGAIGTAQLAAGAVTASTISAGAVTANSLAVGIFSSNMVVNGDFASGDLSSWTNTNGNFTPSITTASGPFSTSNAILLPAATSGGGNPSEASVAFLTKPGHTYIFSFDYGSGSTASSGAYVRIYGQSTKPTAFVPSTATNQINFENQAIPTGWTHEQIVWTATSTAGWCSVWLFNTSTATGVRFTNLSVVEQISGVNIANGGITATQIAAATITGANIAGGTITGSLIAGATITGTNIAGGTITATNIAAGTITSSLIQAGTIVAANIAAGTITGTQIAASTIVASNISVSSLSALSANIGTVTAGVIQSTSGLVTKNLNNGLDTWTSSSNTLVRGCNFGSSSNLMEWYGPTLTVLAGTETIANSNYCMDNTGTIYVGGAAVQGGAQAGVISASGSLGAPSGSFGGGLTGSFTKALKAGGVFNINIFLGAPGTSNPYNSGTAGQSGSWQVVCAQGGSSTVVASGTWSAGAWVSGEGVVVGPNLNVSAFTENCPYTGTGISLAFQLESSGNGATWNASITAQYIAPG